MEHLLSTRETVKLTPRNHPAQAAFALVVCRVVADLDKFTSETCQKGVFDTIWLDSVDDLDSARINFRPSRGGNALVLDPTGEHHSALEGSQPTLHIISV